MYKIGIIGCGKIAQVRHIPEYMANEKTEIVAYYDLNYERAKDLASRYGGKAYSSVDELLKSDVDAVSVCTSNATHAQITIKALEEKKDVLCEKPMAITLEECIEMDRVAKKSNKILMIGQNQRLTKAHQWAHKLIENGEIGRVISFKTTFGHKGPETWSVDPGKNTWFFDKTKAGMGAMADLGIHKTDLIDFLLDDAPSKVTARLATLDKKDSNGNPIGVDDNAFCIYEMKNGAVGTMVASWTFYGKEDNSTVIYGSDGSMKIYSDPLHSIVVEKKKGEVIQYDIDKIQTNDSQTSSGVIDEFVNSLERGYADISSSSVLPAMKAVFAAIESSKSGKTIEIE